MKKTLLKLTLSVLAVGGMALASLSSFAQGGVTPTYTHVPYNDTRNYFIKGAHSSLSQGVVTDCKGRVWTISYALGFYVVNPDGSEYKLPSGDLTYQTPASNSGISQDYVSAIYTAGGGVESFTNSGRGMALSHDCNILITRGNVLYKINAETGAPIARWVSPSSNIAAPAADANGNVFLTSVTENKFYIVKQSASNPSTFEVVMPETALAGRGREAGAVVRSVEISNDGKTLYVPYANRNYIERYTSNDMVNWTKQADIENSAPSNAMFTGPNGLFWYITFGTSGGARPVLHFRDPNNTSFNWSQEFGPEVESNDIRGMSFSKGFDTLYIASGDVNGNIYRFVSYDPIPLSVRKDALAKAVTAFPVPTTGQVTIELPESLRRNAKIQVTDLTGKNVVVRQSAVDRGTSLDLTGLSAGTYLVVLNTPEGNIVRRVVKQ